MKVVRKQQAQIDKQKAQIDELLKQNVQIINKIGTTTNTNTGGATSGGAKNTHRVRYSGNRNTNGNGNCNTNSNDTRSDAGDGTNNRPDNWTSLLEWDVPGSSINKEPMISRIVNNFSQHVKHYTASPTSNYWTLLTNQVEDLGLSHEQTSPHYSSQHKVVSTKSALPPRP